MRTSPTQYEMMVEFMEKNGDLSKPTGGPRGRHFIQMKWKELVSKLNSDGAGDPRSEDKWRKVWSDYKNNCKKKCAKINRAAGGTGGGPALQLSLTDLENRVMHIIGVQAATGMVIEEAGFDQATMSVEKEGPRETSHSQDHQPHEPVSVYESNFCEEDWNTPGTSSQPTVAPPSPSVTSKEVPLLPTIDSVEEEWRPPPQKKTKLNSSDRLLKMFAESDKYTRECARERDRTYEEFERERLRLRNEELRVRECEMQERVRQRDVELQLQAAWMELLKQAMNAFVRYMERKS